MKILIWIGCIFFASAIQVLLSYAGFGGAIPVMVVFFCMCASAQYLCKKYDKRRDKSSTSPTVSKEPICTDCVKESEDAPLVQAAPLGNKSHHSKNDENIPLTSSLVHPENSGSITTPTHPCNDTLGVPETNSAIQETANLDLDSCQHLENNIHPSNNSLPTKNSTDASVSKSSNSIAKHKLFSTSILLAIFIILFIFSASINVLQYFSSKTALESSTSYEAKVENLNNTVNSLNSALTEKEETINSLEKKSSYFDVIVSNLRYGNIGYATSNFNASESIIVVNKHETHRKFTLTAYWNNGGTVSVQHSTQAAEVSFDSDSWNDSVSMTIVPRYEGITVVTFGNDVDFKTFKVIIIVTN